MAWYSGLFNSINLNLGGKAQAPKTLKKAAEHENFIEFSNDFASKVHKGLARYDIEGLPPTAEKRVVKEALFFHGCFAFFQKEGQWIALPCAPDSGLTMTGNITKGFVYGRNGFNKEVKMHIRGSELAPSLAKTYGGSSPAGEKDAVFIRETEEGFPFINFAIRSAENVADTLRTLQIARKNIKRPYIITAEESIISTVKKFFEQRDINMDFIISSGIFPADKINLLPIQVMPEILKSCTDLIEWYNNQYDALCGFNSNSNPDKKERLLVDEVNANNDVTNSYMEETVKFLQEELDFFNEISGYSVKVVRKGDASDDIQGLDRDAGSDALES